MTATISAEALGQSRRAEKFELPGIVESGDPLESFTVDHFVTFIGETFAAQNSDGRTVQFTLISAESTGMLSEWRSRTKGAAYSLMFEAQRRSKLGQDVYTFDHYSLGNFTLLLVPVGLTGRRFEAVINRTQE